MPVLNILKFFSVVYRGRITWSGGKERKVWGANTGTKACSPQACGATYEQNDLSSFLQKYSSPSLLWFWNVPSSHSYYHLPRTIIRGNIHCVLFPYLCITIVGTKQIVKASMNVWLCEFSAGRNVVRYTAYMTWITASLWIRLVYGGSQWCPARNWFALRWPRAIRVKKTSLAPALDLMVWPARDRFIESVFVSSGYWGL